MDPHLSPYQKQILLPEIGAAGQRKIMGQRAPLPRGGWAGEVAEIYAKRAGFAAVEPGATAMPAPPEWLSSGASRSLMAGSLAALHALRAALEKDSL